jgi:hypothetical protein
MTNPPMQVDESSRHRWVGVAILLGLLYTGVGIVFALPGSHARAWRLAAWGVSGIGFTSHIAYERFRLRSAPRAAALHAALAAALGAFGLAVGANLHSLSIESTSRHRQLLLLALGIWPLMTAVPAFLVALVINGVLVRAFPHRVIVAARR